jgi:hypothetical protein
MIKGVFDMESKNKMSRDYNQFELCLQNRDLRKTKELEKSMRKYGFWADKPLTIVRENGKLKIKDGHHRFFVAKSLNIPFYYVINEHNPSLTEINLTVNYWVLKDYLTSYVREGRQSYIFVNKYMERYGITINNAISMLSGNTAGTHNYVDKFKEGIFEIKDISHAETVGDMILYCKQIGIKWASNDLFVRAMSKILQVPKVNINILKRKLNTHKALVEKQPSLEGYINMIDAIYNRASQSKIPLAFLANEEARKRCAIKY